MRARRRVVFIFVVCRKCGESARVSDIVALVRTCAYLNTSNKSRTRTTWKSSTNYTFDCVGADARAPIFKLIYIHKMMRSPLLHAEHEHGSEIYLYIIRLRHCSHGSSALLWVGNSRHRKAVIIFSLCTLRRRRRRRQHCTQSWWAELSLNRNCGICARQYLLDSHDARRQKTSV